PDESGATASTADASEGAAPLDLSVRSDHPAYYEVASTGAKVGLKTAVSLINRYTTRLASMGCTRPPSPYFDTALNPTSGRIAAACSCPGPAPLCSRCQRSAALEAVRLLTRRATGDHLLPSEREARCAVEDCAATAGTGHARPYAWCRNPSPEPAAPSCSGTRLPSTVAATAHLNSSSTVLLSQAG
uniref:SWIM-type domain-containing protein n=1 Tax=Macrostomum lignano TaxID=282301 RepID=A0A1I8IMH4_9PLAT